MILYEQHPELARVLAEFSRPPQNTRQVCEGVISRFASRQSKGFVEAALKSATGLLAEGDRFDPFHEDLNIRRGRFLEHWEATREEWLAAVVRCLRPGNWLSDVLLQREINNWCIQPVCTTCCAMKFRQALCVAAADVAGIQLPVKPVPSPDNLFRDMPDEHQIKMTRATVSSLAELDSDWARSLAVQTILEWLNQPMARFGFEHLLTNTLVGEEIERRHIARAKWAAEWAAKAAKETELRLQKRRDKLAYLTNHHAQKLLRDQHRAEILKELADLSPIDRLARFAGARSLYLDSITDDLIPMTGFNRNDLPEELVDNLLHRIGRRRGSWGLLRRTLENFDPN